MSRSGPVGGAATLSSFRVQKAFSINFRENKKLHTEIKLIENEHIRNIRQVKQEIKETRIWLDNIRESTGYSQHGLRPETASEQRKSGRRRKKIPPRSKTTEPEKMQPPEIVVQSDASDVESLGSKGTAEHSVKEPHVKFAWGGNEDELNNVKPTTAARPWTNTNTSSNNEVAHNHEDARKGLKSEPATSQPRQPSTQEENPEQEDQAADDGKLKGRVQSAASVRSSQASLTTYQRRRKLEAMMMKKRNPLDIKKEMNKKECTRVDTKVQTYLTGLAERMQINLPDLSLWDVDLTRHDTPFSQDLNITV